MVDLPWVNVWLLADGGEAAVVDTGIRWDRGALLRALREAMPTGFTLRTALLTHGHCDHSGNAAHLAERFGAEVACHELEAPYLATRRTYIPRGARALSRSGALFALGEATWPVTRRAPDRLLRDGDTVETPIGPLRVLHTPGHTPGHVSYLHEANRWLFSGDAIINVIPFRRVTGLCLPVPVFTSDMVTAVASARRLAELDTHTLFPGHGWPIVGGAGERLREFLATRAADGSAGIPRDPAQQVGNDG